MHLERLFFLFREILDVSGKPRVPCYGNETLQGWSRGLQGKGRAGEASAGTGSPGNPLFSLFVPKATGCATRALEVSLLWGLTFNF